MLEKRKIINSKYGIVDLIEYQLESGRFVSSTSGIDVSNYNETFESLNIDPNNYLGDGSLDSELIKRNIVNQLAKKQMGYKPQK